MITLDTFKHLLPSGLAWCLPTGSTIRAFFEGLVPDLDDVRIATDDVYDDMFPATTRFIAEWEWQFGLPFVESLTEQQRRDRLDAAWKSQGGQGPTYIQQVLQDNGFDVYIHEWWVPGSNPPVARDPNTYLRKNSDDDPPPIGYPLVNKVDVVEKRYTVQCGEPLAQCGNTGIQCGQFDSFVYLDKSYTIPDDPTLWPYFLYVGGATFPDTVQLPIERKNEFETLFLKIAPAQQWLGILIEWV